jgi:hypothetical protein
MTSWRYDLGKRGLMLGEEPDISGASCLPVTACPIGCHGASMPSQPVIYFCLTLVERLAIVQPLVGHNDTEIEAVLVCIVNPELETLIC